MRVWISADMEGVAGIARDEQTDPSSPLHPAGRHLLTQEVNAAIEGALDAGVQEVVVSDGHWSFTNVLPEELHPRAASRWLRASAPASTPRSSSATMRPREHPTPCSTTPVQTIESSTRCGWA